MRAKKAIQVRPSADCPSYTEIEHLGKHLEEHPKDHHPSRIAQETRRRNLLGYLKRRISSVTENS
jgi:ribosomal protein S15P/S13E